VYSCGSLAPKLSRGGCGCTDIGNSSRTKKPWEITEGLFYFLKEISTYENGYVYVSSKNNLIIEALNYTNFKNADKFHASICFCINVILQEYKKNSKYWKEFKGSLLDDFIRYGISA